MRSSLILLLLSALSACSPIKPLSIDDSIADSDTIIVIGISPKYRVHINEGIQSKGHWKIGKLALNAWPENGYIVAKVPPKGPGEKYGLTMILPEGIGAFTPSYTACNGTETFTFEAPEGATSYVGHITFRLANGSMQLLLQYKLIDAKKALQGNFPGIAEKLVAAPGSFLKVDGRFCGPHTIRVQI